MNLINLSPLKYYQSRLFSLMHILRLYTATVFISICLGGVAIMKNPRQTDGLWFLFTSKSLCACYKYVCRDLHGERDGSKRLYWFWNPSNIRRFINKNLLYVMSDILYTVKTCLRRSATGNYKSGLCWQVAFVQKVRNYFSIFTGRIKTGNLYSQVSLCTGLTVLCIKY